VESGRATLSPDGELEADDLTSLGTFTLRGGRLEFFGLSEARLVQAIALIERRLGSLAGRPRSTVRSVDATITDTATDGMPAREASPAVTNRARRHTASSPTQAASSGCRTDGLACNARPMMVSLRRRTGGSCCEALRTEATSIAPTLLETLHGAG
jgi:hypothetical protein